MKKGHELKIRERLSKSYLQVIFIASISANRWHYCIAGYDKNV